MKIEKYDTAKGLQVQIDEKKDLLANVKKLLPAEKVVKVKIRGTKFYLPKALFIKEHKKIIKDMEDEIGTLEGEFNSL